MALLNGRRNEVNGVEFYQMSMLMIMPYLHFFYAVSENFLGFLHEC